MKRRRFLSDLGKNAFGSQNTFTYALAIVCSGARPGVPVPTPSGVLAVSVFYLSMVLILSQGASLLTR